jgi:hypothetical protein
MRWGLDKAGGRPDRDTFVEHEDEPVRHAPGDVHGHAHALPVPYHVDAELLRGRMRRRVEDGSKGPHEANIVQKVATIVHALSAHILLM